MISEGVVVVYLDDILIFTKDLDEHRWITQRVLARLAEHELYLRPEKCEFVKRSLYERESSRRHNKPDPIYR